MHYNMLQEEAFRLLVVEDDPVSAKSIDYMLRKLGHHLVGTATSGPEAVAMARELAPDLVLMDIQLEGDMDGMEAARRIRQDAMNRGVSIIFLTGLEFEDGLDVALNLADCFIQKPVKVMDLAANLHISIHRRRLERQLAASERRYQALVENAPVGIYQSHIGGRLLTANPALANMLGYASPQELLDRLTNPQAQLYVDAGRRDEFLKTLQDHGQVLEFESEVYGRDGDIFWIQEEASMGLDEQGAPICEGFVLDITARKDAEMERDVSMLLLQQTLAALPDPLALLDEEQRIILANQALCLACHCANAEELTGELFQRALHADSQAQWESTLSECRDGNHCRRLRLRLQRGGWHDFSISPYKDALGERIGCVCLGRAVEHLEEETK